MSYLLFQPYHLEIVQSKSPKRIVFVGRFYWRCLSSQREAPLICVRCSDLPKYSFVVPNFYPRCAFAFPYFLLFSQLSRLLLENSGKNRYISDSKAFNESFSFDPGTEDTRLIFCQHFRKSCNVKVFPVETFCKVTFDVVC